MTRYKRLSDFAKANEVGVDKKLYTKVVNTFFEELLNSILKEPAHIKLPLSMGTIGIVRRKNKGRFVSIVDSVRTSNFELRKNYHSADYRVYLLWDRHSYRFATPAYKRQLHRLKINSNAKIQMADHACRLGLINMYYEYV